MSSNADKYACPCCGSKSLPEASPGTFHICEVCGWEDDNVQFENPDFRGGANELSLNEARAQFLSARDRGILVRVPSLERPVRACYAADWYDGPLQGGFVLDNPIEEIGFKTIAMRYNPDGLDLRFAKAWPLPHGTVATANENADSENSGQPSASADRDRQSAIRLLVNDPKESELFIAFSSGDRIQAAWESCEPCVLTAEQAEQMLKALPFEDD